MPPDPFDHPEGLPGVQTQQGRQFYGDARWDVMLSQADATHAANIDLVHAQSEAHIASSDLLRARAGYWASLAIAVVAIALLCLVVGSILAIHAI